MRYFQVYEQQFFYNPCHCFRNVMVYYFDIWLPLHLPTLRFVSQVEGEVLREKADWYKADISLEKFLIGNQSF